jgi:hypothetical protein
MEKIDIAKAMAAQWAGAAAAGGGGPAAGDPAWSIDGWHSEQVVVMLDELLMTAKTLPAAQLAQMEELCDESTFAGWLRWPSTAHGLLRVADLVWLMPWLVVGGGARLWVAHTGTRSRQCATPRYGCGVPPPRPPPAAPCQPASGLCPSWRGCLSLAARPRRASTRQPSQPTAVHRWQMLGVASAWSPVYPQVVEFLESQGRMKFVRPLYRNLFRVGGAGRELALATFARCQPRYHNIAAKMISRDLELTS